MPKRKRSSITCCICMTTPKNKASLDGCSHEFCRKCIVKWSKTENSCPVCRQTFNCVQTEKSTTRISDRSQNNEDEQLDALQEYFMDIVIEYIFNPRFQFMFYSDCMSRPTEMKMHAVDIMYETITDPPFVTAFSAYTEEMIRATMRITDLQLKMTISRAISVI